MSNQWKTLARRVVLERGKFLTVEDHTVQLSDGTIIEGWPWLITPDYVNVVVVTEVGQFVCFRQNKYAVDGEALAPVGGYIEPGEDPLDAAQRETLEETGYEAPDWTPLGSYPVDGNRGAGTAHFFLAQNANKVTEPNADDLEEQILLLLTRDEIETAVREGAFKLVSWQAIMALALLHMD